MGVSTGTGGGVSAQRFLRRLQVARRVAGTFGLLRVLVALVGAAGVAGILLILLAVSGFAGIVLLRGMWALFWGGILFLFFVGLWVLRDMMSLGAVAEKLRTLPRDQVLTAAELASENRSDEFRVRAIDQAEGAFPADWIIRLGAGGWRPLLVFVSTSLFLFGAAVLKTPGAVLGQALWPFRPEETGIRSVSPGDAVFPRGDDVTVTVRVSTGNVVPPVLEVRSAGGRWETRTLWAISTGAYTGCSDR
ncbi:MAG: hypothetical protein IPN90_12220 [Elusimicrobia bacterium]|nr:hypothetical protein [Elusimicrobiota bacterium]